LIANQDPGATPGKSTIFEKKRKLEAEKVAELQKLRELKEKYPDEIN